ncbi:MAG: MBL fold metallo-hydrolase [bacterium]
MSIKLTLLGTGTFFVSEKRSSSAYLLEIDEKKILIDCGPGTLMRLSQVGVDVAELDYVFITHLHADHTSDLFPLFMNYRLLDFSSEGKKTDYPKFIGPQKIAEFILQSSRNHELLAVEGWEKVRMRGVQSRENFGNIEVESFPVSHTAFGKSAEAYAYRFTVNGKVISFSGDSIKCDGVEKVCINADLFVCDASYPKGKGNPAHMDTIDIGSIGESSQVKKIILSHFYPPTDNVNLVAEVKERFSGEVVRGEDLMSFTIEVDNIPE